MNARLSSPWGENHWDRSGKVVYPTILLDGTYGNKMMLKKECNHCSTHKLSLMSTFYFLSEIRGDERDLNFKVCLHEKKKMSKLHMCLFVPVCFMLSFIASEIVLTQAKRLSHGRVSSVMIQLLQTQAAQSSFTNQSPLKPLVPHIEDTITS